MSVPAVLVVTGLQVRRGGRVVLDGASLTVHPGEIVAVLGANGRGKSTLLAAVAGALSPRAGTIAIDGDQVWGARGAAARRRLGYAPEAADPPPHLTGGELWALVAAARGAAPPSESLAAALRLPELAGKRLGEMSLGQRRRACLAAALLGPPRLLVLDEPDNGLDAAALAALVGLLGDHAAGGGATLVATHDPALVETLDARRFAL
ncbi:MAG: ATP-binding cassette domain-containing protein [Kofleriaceae bacterium]